MSVLEKIAFYQNRRDEEPNKALAKELAETRNAAGIQEIAAHLWDKEQNVRSDCLGVLYHIGYVQPELIAPYVADFLKLLKDKNNRMVWGGMIALATIAALRPAEIWQKIEDIIAGVEHGTLISVVWGVKTLAVVAANNPAYSERINPVLLNCLQTCLPRDVPMHAESMLPAINAANREQVLSILAMRQPELTPAQMARLKKVLKAIR